MLYANNTVSDIYCSKDSYFSIQIIYIFISFEHRLQCGKHVFNCSGE